VGKPYDDELGCLSATYSWALSAPLGDLPQALRGATGLPLVAVGSGGSYTSAQFAVAIHRRYCSAAATAMTPLEAVATPQSLRQAAVLLLTAGGRNADVLGAFKRLAEREPRRLLVFCARAGSPLAQSVSKHSTVDFAEFEPPSGKDGFLATNSLLATVVILIRAYVAAFNAPTPLPDKVDDLFLREAGRTSAQFDHLCESLWRRQNLVVLYGPDCHAAAVDLESKFSEAALGTVQLADFRNFAHGRHHWLAKRGGETAVLAIVPESDRRLADPLLALLPKGIPVLRISVAGKGLTANLSALLQVFMVVGSAGKARGIDPGNPGVPPFGRRIFHLQAFVSSHDVLESLPAAEAAAIERKARASVTSLLSRGTLDDWRASYRLFCDRLAAAKFRAIVLDYDGTLCSETRRFEPLQATISRQLNRLLRTGAVLGVATGRGKSVKATLRQAIQPNFWKRVVVGYYNGGDIATLADDSRPDATASVSPTLEPITGALRAAFGQSKVARLTFRLPQVTIEPATDANRDEIWDSVEHLIHSVGGGSIGAVRSSHSIDVVAAGVTKRAVVAHIVEQLSGDANTPVLCIGDRGCWPGNDYALLSTPYALSVDEVSSDRETGWNLAAPGRRGVVAALDYLQRLAKTKDGLRIST
jgi:hydroxymethylpyrimidine pyrophosphatase-like HAD family hydrolase/fructoselysine-6-P-deglycase FrlB-like protein